jgi:hypothetical protein
MTVRSKTELVNTIGLRIPDNNAGQISAADVRTSMLDIVDSINQIVASGNFNSETPFVNHVRLQTVNGAGGILHVGSGITFTNGGGTQYVPYPGPTGLTHNTLQGLGDGDPHTQYVTISGTRPFINNVPFDNNWLNSSGSSTILTTTGRGLQFQYAGTGNRENINVGSGTQFTFLKDKSVLSSARGAAKAWINFDASGSIPVVNDSYNVSGLIKESAGHFLIVFHSGVLKDNNYVAIGNSNASSTNDNGFFQKNTVGLSKRLTRPDGTQSITFYVMDDGGQFCNAKVNDLVIYGTEPTGSGNPPVTVTVL